MEHKKTILIFGISSFLGSSLAEKLKDDFSIVGTYYDTPVHIEGVLAIKCDVHNKDLVQKVVYLFKPDITVYTIGLTDLNACQEHPKLADALNTAGVFNVSQASERYHSKFIYFSSSYIFSGDNTLFRENDTPMPTSIYGNTMASSEFFIQKSCLNYVILRCAPIFGRSYHHHDLKFVEAVEREEFLGNRILCDDKVYTGFVDTSTISHLLKMVIEKNITNRLLQISSSDLMTRYEFTKLFLESGGGNSGLLVKGDWKFPRTENQLSLQHLGEELYFRMDTYNILDEFEFKMPSIEEMILNYKKDLEGTISTASKRAKSTGVNFI
jgi:dTDP-4-dehydrorhamnose reductase